MTESRNQKWNKSHSFTQLSATESDVFVKVQDRAFAKTCNVMFIAGSRYGYDLRYKQQFLFIVKGCF